MNWISRLNAAPRLECDGARIYNWSYEAHLLDNALHRHAHFEICLVGAYGRGVFAIEGQELPIESGDLFIARPGVVHQIRNSGDALMELFWVSFDWSAVLEPPASSSIERSPAYELLRALANSPVTVARDDGLIFNLWKALRDVAAGEQHAGKDAQLAALQWALLLQIAAVGAGNRAPAAPIPKSDAHHLARLAARYIHDNLARKLSVAEIAAHLHLSPRHFGRLFAQFAGVSPSVYLQTARMERARHLLRATSEPIKSIAGAVGLPDVHHFTRVFGKCCGVSPAAYRNEIGAEPVVVRAGALI